MISWAIIRLDCNKLISHAKRNHFSMLKWTRVKPAVSGWYWFRGEVHEIDPFIVLVDEAGQFQWPDGGYQEVALAKGEWAGPIEEPSDS